MQRLFLLIFLSGLIEFAFAQNVLKKLDRVGNNIFLLTDGRQFTIRADTLLRVSIIEINGSQLPVKLKFFIKPDVTTDVYSISGKYGEVIIVESYIPEPLGLSASIINLSFLLVEKNNIISTEFSNSFYKGIESITIGKDGTISVRTLEFLKYVGNYSPICCVSNFVLSNFFKFERTEVPFCINYESGSVVNSRDCSCPAETTSIIFEFD